MLKKSVFTLAVSAAAVVTASQASADVMAFGAPIDDGFVRWSSPGNSLDTRLLIGNNGFANGPLRGLISYDLSSIAAGSTINSVTLALPQTGGGNDTFLLTEVAAFTSSTSWNDLDATPVVNEAFGATLQTTTSTGNGTNTTFATSGSFEDYVEAALGGTVYFAIQADVEADTGGFSRYEGAAPTLTIDYTPIPEPGSLALLGLGGLLIVRRRRG